MVVEKCGLALRARSIRLLRHGKAGGALLASFCLGGSPPLAAGSCATPGAGHEWSAAEVFVEPSPFNGIHGLAIDPEGDLVAASLFGGRLWSVDRVTGAAKVLVDRPEGQADDIAFGPEGEMAWTSKLEGKVRYRKSSSGKVQVLASLPSVNSIGFDPKNGRLYAAQVFGADALWEIDRSGAKAPRLIARNLGGLNSFDIGTDGRIYGPLQDKGVVARIDPSSGHASVIADGFSIPGPFSVKIAPDGHLWAGNQGRLIRVDVRTRRKSVAVRMNTIADDLAIGRNGDVYISDGSRNAIHVYTPATQSLRELIPPRIALPAGLNLSGGRLWVASAFALRSIDLQSRAIREEFHEGKIPFPTTVSAAGGRVALSSMLLGVVAVFDQEDWQPLAILTDLSLPSDAVFLNDRSLLYAEHAKGWIVRASGARFSKREIVASGLKGPVQMIAARSGALYVTESSGVVKEVSLSSPAVTRDVVSGLQGPEGLAETAWGSLIVAEAGRRRLIEVDPETGISAVIAEDLPIGLTVTSALPAYTLPTGVAVDRDGTIYLSADENNAIYRFRCVDRGTSSSEPPSHRCCSPSK